MNDIKLYEKPKPFYNNSLVKFQHAKETDTSEHWHEHLEFIFYKSSGYFPRISNKELKIEKNDMIIIKPNELHCNYGSGEGYCVLRYHTDFFKYTVPDIISFKQHIHADETIKSLFEKMEKEYERLNEGFDLEIMGIACQLITYLIRNYKDENITPEEILLTKKQMSKVNEFIIYITKHYDEKITTSSIASTFNLSERYFSTLFKNHTGYTPTNYINKYRIEKAEFFLETTDLNIAEIAEAVGFDDQNYFSRTFKKYTNTTPQKYRIQSVENTSKNKFE